MTLGEKQRYFAGLVANLLIYIYSRGYEVSLDWCYRPPEIAEYYTKIGVGIRSSLHTLKLAIDLNLFKDGIWLRNTEDHKIFGEYWEALNPLCRWGGRFGDGNHYSLEHDGVK